MLQKIVCWGLCLTAAACFAKETSGPLPQPHFHAQASDPPWLERVVRLHGHLGPSVVAGARLGMAGLRAVGAKGYFDVDVACAGPFAGPPESCLLDGVQVATGATLGKRNLRSVDAEQIVVRICNTRTKKTAEVRPSKRLVELLKQAKRQGKTGGEGRIEQIARHISVMPDEEILTVVPVK